MNHIVEFVRSGRPLAPKTERLILVLLCIVFCAELFSSTRQLSQTADEATHLYSGYRYLVCSDLTVSPEHPPLAKAVAAIPLVAMNLPANCEPFKGGDREQALMCLNWFYSQDWHSILPRARLAASIFALGVCLLVWMFARRMFDLPTAIVATLLLVFEPNVLAFGPLVMTDVPVTCMMLFAIYAFYQWSTRRIAPFLLLTGLAMGLALLAKHSGVLLLPILVALAVADALMDRKNEKTVARAMLNNLRGVALIGVIAYCVVWLGYGMHFAAHPGAVQYAGSSTTAASGISRSIMTMKQYHALPEAYLQGFDTALAISNDQGLTLIAGKTYLKTPWYAVPFYLLIRNTSAAIVMFGMAAAGVVVASKKKGRELAFLIIPAGLFLAVCIRSSMIGGVRYLLPVFPFLLIATAAGCVELARQRTWFWYVVASLIIFHAASSLHAYPNYLSYANEFWGGPQNSYRYLGWLDIGQAYPQAKIYLETHSGQDCWFFTAWQWDPKLYGVPCQTIGNYLESELPPRIRGTVVVSATLLKGAGLAEQALAAPFQNVTPLKKLGGSALLVYEGEFDTRKGASMSEINLARQALRGGQTASAMMHAERAVQFAPGSSYAHGFMCLFLADMQQRDPAIEECRTAERLVLSDPLREEPQRKDILDTVRARLTLLDHRGGQ